ncbi:carbohydrate-binding protein [Shimazuella soli]|uniref:carbohydrate-binding protein n=1 Tax=Shimazuella soli TaxID=1892854 RepID=UPI001F0D3C38|nr:carbohydrate-binding protein [Shimazuella soli]
MLESRLEKFTRKATVEKLVKIRRYRMMLFSVGLSMIVFVAYSFIFPVTVKEGSIHVMNDNQALPLRSEKVHFAITKEEKTNKPIQKKDEKTMPSTAQQSMGKLEEVAPSPSQVATKKATVFPVKPKENRAKKIPPQIYPEWNENKTYQAGDRVMYKEKVYQANETNKNSPPDENNVLFGDSWDEVEE